VEVKTNNENCYTLKFICWSYVWGAKREKTCPSSPPIERMLQRLKI